MVYERNRFMLFFILKIRVPKAPWGLNRYKYVRLQARLQHHIFVSVGVLIL